jgi:hypothetical protein
MLEPQHGAHPLTRWRVKVLDPVDAATDQDAVHRRRGERDAVFALQFGGDACRTYFVARRIFSTRSSVSGSVGAPAFGGVGLWASLGAEPR